MSRTSFLLFLLLCAFGHGRVLAQSGCGILDDKRPLLFISYERTIKGAKEKEVQLRLWNNSTCAIVVDTYEEPPKQTLAEVLSRRSVCVPSNFPELPDGSPVRMSYEVRLPKRNLTLPLGGGGDSINAATLRSGRSVIFDVPRKYFREGGELRLNFQYDWEVCKVALEKTVIMRHEIYFFPWFVPKDVLN